MTSKRPRKPARSKRRASSRPAARARAGRDPLLAPTAGAAHREVGGVAIDVAEAANGRVKRLRVRGSYADGCAFDVAAPRAIVLEPGHDAWVVGREPAVLIEFDALNRTAERFGLPPTHQHP